MFAPSPGVFRTAQQHRNWRGLDAQQIIARLGLGTGLQVCLDAGDATSAPSSATSWVDISGNGYDFFLGTTSGADATDPTQTGTVGALTSGEYFSSDGGDLFTYDTTNETWMQNLHKDNAAFTFVVLKYLAIGADSGIFGTALNATEIGTSVFFDSNPRIVLQIRNATGGGTNALQIFSSVVATAKWHFLAGALDEANDVTSFVTNATNTLTTAAYTSPSASNATRTMQIGAIGGSSVPMASSNRMAIFLVWSRVLSFRELH